MSSVTSESAIEAVIAEFIATGEPVTSARVAEMVGVSESTVRRRLNDSFKAERGWIRVAPTKVDREVPVSRDYPSMGTRSVPVSAWRVPASHLCSIIRSMRAPN